MGGTASNFVEGSKILAKRNQTGNWYPGEIVRVNLDGTFDILYDDGNPEIRVKSDMIKHAFEKTKRVPPCWDPLNITSNCVKGSESSENLVADEIDFVEKVYSNGDVYRGQWKNDMWDGKGT